MLTIKGTIEKIQYSSEDTGYKVLSVRVQDELVTVVGTAVSAAVGEIIIADGTFKNHVQYGRQFAAQMIRCELPSDLVALEHFLASDIVKGIGPKLAKNLVTEYGQDVLTVLMNNTEEIAKIKGIGSKKAKVISEQVRVYITMHNLMAFASDNGIPNETAIQIWDLWKEKSLEFIQDNPYCLCREDLDLDFFSVDNIARNQGVCNPMDFNRLRAGICYVLAQKTHDGSLCMLYQNFIDTATTMMKVEASDLAECLEKMEQDETIAFYQAHDERYIYLFRYYESEVYCKDRFTLFLQNPPDLFPTFEEELEKIENKLHIRYDETQRKAIKTAVTNRMFVLTGGPGTGKTTIICGILEMLSSFGEKIALAAPTGRAAKRMGEVTGYEAKTIHRLLEIKVGSNGREFVHNERNPLEVNTVIIDEASMVDSMLMMHLLRAMPFNSRLLLVGDADQLPSVGPGNILSDLITSDVVPMTLLGHNYRQADASGIIVNASRIISGDMPSTEKDNEDFFIATTGATTKARDWLVDAVVRRLPSKYGFDPLTDIQIITPTKKGPLGTDELNSVMQQMLNPPSNQKEQYETVNRVFRVGDRVMQIKNNYDIPWTISASGEDGMGIFNGDIGIITMVDLGSKTFGIDFEGKEVFYPFENVDQLEHAYAITVHKAQGSEFKAVVLAVGGCPWQLLYRSLLYTAVTRAKAFLLLVGSREEIQQMVASAKVELRSTNLKGMLQEYFGF